MKRLILTVAASLILSAPSFAWGWAHRMIAYIAQEHSTPATRAVYDRYLDSPLNNIALWPDIFRCRLWAPQDFSDAPDYTFKSWEHAVSVGPDYYPLLKSNRPEGNGEGYAAILGYIERLQNYKEMSDSAVVVDMTALVHMVADNHCPGHILYSKPDGSYDPMGGGIAGGYGIYTHSFNGKSKHTLHSLIDGADAIHNEEGLPGRPVLGQTPGDYRQRRRGLLAAGRRAAFKGDLRLGAARPASGRQLLLRSRA